LKVYKRFHKKTPAEAAALSKELEAILDENATPMGKRRFGGRLTGGPPRRRRPPARLLPRTE
jgi:hypothetical protein